MRTKAARYAFWLSLLTMVGVVVIKIETEFDSVMVLFVISREVSVLSHVVLCF
jgi:hypothetical protein